MELEKIIPHGEDGQNQFKIDVRSSDSIAAEKVIGKLYCPKNLKTNILISSVLRNICPRNCPRNDPVKNRAPRLFKEKLYIISLSPPPPFSR
ncbi:MAG: hypothetical protein JSS30_06245 [Verrucomicrobia bacterium]|nr:hypothetical protein [Verrucomicrobiota bacterium]